MGWIEIPQHFESHAKKEAFVRSLFDAGSIHCLMRDGTVYYIAAHHEGEVKAYVVQTYQKYIYNGHNTPTRVFGYKVESERGCPTHYDAPCSLTKLLTPTVDSGALKWRALCERTQNNRKVLRLAPIGTKLHLVDKATGDVVLIQENGKRMWVNESRTSSYPISLLARQSFRVEYPCPVIR